ncbi:glycoside hydrolase family 55 protein [Dissoconium aciculare CBS 342.82]|uniref:Glycoside hydrolase family 55 protein n=1 Tax=Dissoconium aciculare CBS 342.82 TaxID=1314786 RepID=A0A6J3LRL3_9PEZI|nr:glycoside hydrolase family 55 protein [Dissoconium aciculare CBS 342.82]KAF1818258.1 glycoside hydrolase family 55 protein [Dissoconium aciculare CBS 342.82]
MSILGRLALLVGLATALPLTSTIESDAGVNNTIITSSALDSRAAAASSSSWWFPNIDYSNSDWANYDPNLGNNYNYPVYVSVSDANGLTNAIASNNRPNGDLAAQPRVIYIAPGTYTLSSTLYLYTDTILIGDAVNPPTIRASSNFDGSQLIAGGKDQNDNDGGGELKFSTMIKNVILDTTANSGQRQFTALSWRVAQNSGLVNVVINLPSGAHTGMTVGQGSTIQIGDVTFNYGNIGLEYDGSQQATLKNLAFNKCTTGISITGGNTINIFHPTFNTVGFPIVLQDGVGAWVSVVDGTTTNSGTFFNSKNKYPNFMLENIVADSSKNPVVVVAGTTKVSGRTQTNTYVYGNTVGANPIYQTNNQPVNMNRPSALTTGNGFYPVVTANQYQEARVSDVINLKNYNQNGGVKIKGDGNTNDGPNLQSALNYAAQQGKIAFLPYGVYRTLQTITIPAGTELVGNGWSTISGYGSAFTDASNPKPVVQIGTPGSSGTAHIQDIRFTVGQQLPGAIILQVNLAGSKPGDVSISNSLITVGGLPDTEINCGNAASCQAAYLGLHLSSSSSAYIDNMWVWVADHPSDGSGNDIHIAAKGGVLVEATKGTWLAGLGAEHFWLYQVSYNRAANVFISLLQSETNYQQGQDSNGNQIRPRPAAPYANALTASDPDFSWCGNRGPTCYKSVAQYFSKNKSSAIYSYAAGSWNFDIFGGTQDFMNVMSSVPDASKFYGLTAHNTQLVMRLPDGSSFGDADHYGGSWGNLVAAYST